MSSSEAISQFTNPYPVAPYEIIDDYRGPDRVMSKLESFNYEIVHRSPGTTLETAKVVIILERHQDPFYKFFYGLVLDRFYKPSNGCSIGDTLFLEAAIYTDVWNYLYSEVKKYSKLRDKSSVLGWGDYLFYRTVREPFKKERERIIEHALESVHKLYRYEISGEEKIEAERVVKDACPSLEEVRDHSQLASMAHSLLIEEVKNASDTAFMTNQKELIRNIKANSYSKEKTLFFICGKHHAHLRSLKKAKYERFSGLIKGVEDLYQSLEGREFIIIYPKKPKIAYSEMLRQLGIDPTPPPPPTAVQATMNFIRSFF